MTCVFRLVIGCLALVFGLAHPTALQSQVVSNEYQRFFVQWADQRAAHGAISFLRPPADAA